MHRTSSQRNSAMAWIGVLGLVACSGGGDTAPTYRISGTVGGATRSGVTITLSGASRATTTTDASGNYAVAGLAPGSHTLTPSKTGFVFSPSVLHVMVTDADASGKDFTATAVYLISGTVTGATLSGVTITLSAASSRTATTDDTGNFGFSGILNGAYTLTPSKGGFAFDPATIAVAIEDEDATGNDFTALDLEWANWPIPGIAPGNEDYSVDAAAGTVTDNVTGLTWQRVVDAGWYDWDEAKSYCSGLVLGDSSWRWRLPTLIELASLPDFTVNEPAINAAIFPSTPADRYWTSTPDASQVGWSWAVNFRNGETVSRLTVNIARARCLRNDWVP
jgi:hypothetical protein